MPAAPTKPPLRVVLYAPRGFRAGVAHAIGVAGRALEGGRSLAVTVGASAPETPVDRVVEALRDRREIKLGTLTTAAGSMAFPHPRPAA